MCKRILIMAVPGTISLILANIFPSQAWAFGWMAGIIAASVTSTSAKTGKHEG